MARILAPLIRVAQRAGSKPCFFPESAITCSVSLSSLSDDLESREPASFVRSAINLTMSSSNLCMVSKSVSFSILSPCYVLARHTITISYLNVLIGD